MRSYVAGEPDLDSAYYLRFEPERSRLVIDSWPRAGDIPYWIDSERPIALKAGVPVKVKVFLDGSVCVVYVDERIALSTRMYDLHQQRLGSVRDGRFSKVHEGGHFCLRSLLATFTWRRKQSVA